MLTPFEYTKAIESVNNDIEDSQKEVKYLEKLLKVKPSDKSHHIIAEIEQALEDATDPLLEHKGNLEYYQEFEKLRVTDLVEMILKKSNEIDDQIKVIEYKLSCNDSCSLHDKITLRVLEQMLHEHNKQTMFLKVTYNRSKGVADDFCYVDISTLEKLQHNQP